MKPLAWVGSSKKDLQDMPEDVKDIFGFALHQAQVGSIHSRARPLSGFGSAGVLEVVEVDDGNAYRAVYTVKFPNAVYVLHCFKKKSNKGIATPKPDMNLIRERLGSARKHSEAMLSNPGGVGHEQGRSE